MSPEAATGAVAATDADATLSTPARRHRIGIGGRRVRQRKDRALSISITVESMHQLEEYISLYIVT